jgi:hypothetical protein
LKLDKRNPATLAFMAALTCLLVYVPALFCDFINWDDPLYIINNPGIRILDGQFVREAFTTSYLGWWMPLTWISFAIDYHFWELNPLGYHLTNVLLHTANTGLVVLVADELLRHVKKEIRNSGGYLYPCMLVFTGLLWGLHPLRVESVAWVTERKDTLNGIFSLGAVFCYLRFARMRDVAGYTGPIIRMYTLSLLFLLLSLMSKPVSVVIPAMLLVADWYPLKRLRKEKALQILLEKIPFVILVTTVSFATVYFAAGNSILVAFDDLTLTKRFLLAGNSLFEYCRLTLYPVNIIHIYLLPWPFPISYTIKSLFVVAFSCFCAWNYKKNPWLPATWLAFILPLLPVLGFLQNGAQSHAARFTYLPGIAPSICVAGLMAVLYDRAGKSAMSLLRTLLAILAGVSLQVCVTITEIHLAAWKNPETLWTRAIEIKPVGRAYYLRADYFLAKGRYLEAATDLQASFNMGKKAGFPEAFNLIALRGDALSKAGHYDEAVKDFTEAIALFPAPNYFYHRGLAQEAQGNLKEAQADFLRAGDSRGSIEWRKLK